jgi:hypothetical protein
MTPSRNSTKSSSTGSRRSAPSSDSSPLAGVSAPLALASGAPARPVAPRTMRHGREPFSAPLLVRKRARHFTLAKPGWFEPHARSWMIGRWQSGRSGYSRRNNPWRRGCWWLSGTPRNGRGRTPRRRSGQWPSGRPGCDRRRAPWRRGCWWQSAGTGRCHRSRSRGLACGNEVRGKRKDARFCSGACRQRAHRKAVTDKNKVAPRPTKQP